MVKMPMLNIGSSIGPMLPDMVPHGLFAQFLNEPWEKLKILD